MILAGIVAGVAIYKAQVDDQNREFMKEAVAANFKPTPAAKQMLYEEVLRVAQKLAYKQKDVDYEHVSDGMVFFLKNSKDEDEEIVFDNSELGHMYANQISHTGNDQIIEDALTKKADFSNYNEDTYNRVNILLTSSVERVIHAQPTSVYYDNDGFTADFAGRRVSIPISDVKAVSKPSFSSALAELDKGFTEKVKTVMKAQ